MAKQGYISWAQVTLPTASPNAALSGTAVTASAGPLSVLLESPVAGFRSDTARGTLSAVVGQAVTLGGQAGTSAAGSLSAADSTVLSALGIGALASYRAPTPALSKTATGLAATLVAGGMSTAQNSVVALSGNLLTTSFGALYSRLARISWVQIATPPPLQMSTAALTGGSATVQFSPPLVFSGQTQTLTGAAVTTALGTVGTVAQRAVSGQQAGVASGAVAFSSDPSVLYGTLTPSNTEALGGVALTTSRGLLGVSSQSSSTQQLGGVAITAQRTAPTPEAQVALDGDEVTADSGSITAGNIALVPLDGQEANSDYGDFVPANITTASGLNATATAGVAVGLPGEDLVGEELTSAAGTVATDASLLLSGIGAAAASGALGNIVDDSTLTPLIGQSVASTVGAFTIDTEAVAGSAVSTAAFGALGAFFGQSVTLTGQAAVGTDGSAVGGGGATLGGQQGLANFGVLTGVGTPGAPQFDIALSGATLLAGSGLLNFNYTTVGLFGQGAAVGTSPMLTWADEFVEDDRTFYIEAEDRVLRI